MIISFFGHSSIYRDKMLATILKETIKKHMVHNDETIFYCGGYGDFDYLCATVCSSLKKEMNNCKVAYITPYITESHQKNINEIMSSGLYDVSIYPPLENVPFRYAISRRNEWMVNEADLVIAYIKNTYGGAYKSFLYAKKKGKTVINLAEIK